MTTSTLKPEGVEALATFTTSLLFIAFFAVGIVSPVPRNAKVVRLLAPRSFEREVQPVSQKAEITEANWQQHPRIIAVRRIVAPINARLKKGAYKTSERRFEHCDDNEFDGVIVRRIAVGAKGTPVWYKEFLESEDRSVDFHYYYDPSSRLRFVLIHGYSVGGGRRDVRIYFDEAGKRIWEDHQFIRSGGGGPWPAVWEAEFQMTDPAKEFAASSHCPEIKAKRRRG